MKTTLLLATLLLFSLSGNAQKLRMEKSFWSEPTFFEGDNSVSEDLFFEKLNSDEDAAKELSGFKLKYYTSLVLGVAGGFVFGWQIGYAIGGQTKPNWGVAGAGAAVIGVALYLESSAYSNVEKAVVVYNSKH